ncbi:MAG: tyrosine-protein phosphatase [Clostridia bacterium]|nr:tyrosine-protein phosphatase [Clostridia bacterium]
MKNGLFMEDGKLVYYANDLPKHAGVVQVGEDIYYIGSHGLAVKGRHVVRTAMSNGILKHGTYTFGEDYRLVEGSYIPPEKVRRKSKKKKQGLKKLLKNKKLRIWVPVALLAVFLLSLIAMDESLLHRSPVQNGDVAADPKAPVSSEYRPPISLPTFDEEVLLCSEAAQRVYEGELTMADVYKTGDPYRSLAFQYNLQGQDGLLILSENQKLSGGEEYILPKDNTVLVIDNLKTDTDYYYKVKVGQQDYVGSFHTAKSTRYVYIPGAKNTRDIGGYKTLDGKKVKQGLLIRGTEIDGIESSYILPSSEVENVQNTFSFVYDMDLRSSGLLGDSSAAYRSYLGENVGHEFYGAPQYGQIFNAVFQANLRRIFSALADAEKYPMYLHCTWGRDRTGTIVYLLQGLLNMSEEDMKREFTLSGFLHTDLIEPTYLDAIDAGLQPYDGNTLQEKIVTFLTTVVGVTDEEIASIRRIFLED